MEQPLKCKSDLKIVLLGKTGAGKSASGNTIIGGDRNTFKEDLSPESVTTCCESAHTKGKGKGITVIDTVGLSDKTYTDFQTKTEAIFQYACNGVDVFLLVIKLTNRYTYEEQKAVKWIQENFGAKASKHTLVLFTHGDQLDVSMEKFFLKSILLGSLVDQCAGRYHVFNNKDENQDQVTKLIEKFESLRVMNQNNKYTKMDFENAQKELLHKKIASGAAIGGATGALGGVIAAKIGAVSLPAVKSAILGATGGVVVAVVMVYMLKMYLIKVNLSKFVPRNKDKND